MKQKTVLCYGDSNTYGFDPRGMLGGRYEKENRWCDLLAQRWECQVVNAGENGRMIPTDCWRYQQLQHLLEQAQPDLLLVMLGSNDLLLGHGTPEVIAGRMVQLLEKLQADNPALPLVVLSPPRTTLAEFTDACAALSQQYGMAAERLGVPFVDTCAWDIPLAYDGVHFSEAGHHLFAAHLAAALQTLWLVEK